MSLCEMVGRLRVRQPRSIRRLSGSLSARTLLTPISAHLFKLSNQVLVRFVLCLNGLLRLSKLKVLLFQLFRLSFYEKLPHLRDLVESRYLLLARGHEFFHFLHFLSADYFRVLKKIDPFLQVPRFLFDKSLSGLRFVGVMAKGLQLLFSYY